MRALDKLTLEQSPETRLFFYNCSKDISVKLNVNFCLDRNVIINTNLFILIHIKALDKLTLPMWRTSDSIA